MAITKGIGAAAASTLDHAGTLRTSLPADRTAVGERRFPR